MSFAAPVPAHRPSQPLPAHAPVPPMSQRPARPSRRWLRHGMLTQIAAFEAVLRHGSVTRAAEALCVAQPTLSGHLRKLAEALGVQLFEQRGKRLEPTREAELLLATTHEVFGALARCEQALAAARGAGPGGPARQ